MMKDMSKFRSLLAPARLKAIALYTSLTLISLAMLGVGYIFITNSDFYLYLEQTNPANHRH
jgi:hypothetical protein